jgi:uncharacterized phage protein (TIGR01671 family)
MTMREILFRGKSLGNGDWLEDSLFIDDKGEKHEILAGYVNYRLSWEVDPESVGQSTSLKDKNGRRLFEGDICRAKNLLHNGKEELFTVEWCENGFFLVDDTGTTWHPCYLEDIENIGNIHDHPELLGGANA